MVKVVSALSCSSQFKDSDSDNMNVLVTSVTSICLLYQVTIGKEVILKVQIMESEEDEEGTDDKEGESKPLHDDVFRRDENKKSAIVR